MNTSSFTSLLPFQVPPLAVLQLPNILKDAFLSPSVMHHILGLFKEALAQLQG